MHDTAGGSVVRLVESPGMAPTVVLFWTLNDVVTKAGVVLDTIPETVVFPRARVGKVAQPSKALRGDDWGATAAPGTWVQSSMNMRM